MVSGPYPPSRDPIHGNSRDDCSSANFCSGIFQLFLTRELLVFLAEGTHFYAIYCRDVLKRDNAKNWEGCNLADMAHYLGLVRSMGMQRLPAMHLYWAQNQMFSNPIFPQTMPYSWFLEIGRYFHAYERLAVPADYTEKLIWVRSVMEYLQRLCKALYNPRKEMSLDEGMLPYKGRFGIKIYSPQKPDKYGVKFYYLCESS